MAYRQPKRRTKAHPRGPGYKSDALELLEERIGAEVAAAGRTQVTLAEVLQALHLRRMSHAFSNPSQVTERAALAYLHEQFHLVPNRASGFFLPGWTPPEPVPIQPTLF